MVHKILKRLPEIIAYVTSPSQYLYEITNGHKAFQRPGDNPLWDILVDVSNSWKVLDKTASQVLYLYYLQCWTDDLIAHELGLERSTVTRARHRATAQLVNHMIAGEYPDRPCLTKGRDRDLKAVKTLVVFYD